MLALFIFGTLTLIGAAFVHAMILHGRETNAFGQD